MVHLSSDQIEMIQQEVIKASGGLNTKKQTGVASSLVARVLNAIHYSGIEEIEKIAATYVDSIANGHVFSDGNKRTALICLIVFLDLNEFEFTGNKKNLAKKIEGVADKSIDVDVLSSYLKPKIKNKSNS